MHRLAALSLVTCLAAAAPAQAQVFGRSRTPPPPKAAPQIDCAALARMPNAPMTAEACQAMMNQAAAVQINLNRRDGDRPGDEQLTCPQIKAELALQPGFGAGAQANARDAKAAGDDLQATQRRLQAQGAAIQAQQLAGNVAAAAVSQLPGGNVVVTAKARADAAQSQAFAYRAAGQMKTAESRSITATAGSIGDVNQAMNDNPRLARLVQLMSAKTCR